MTRLAFILAVLALSAALVTLGADITPGTHADPIPEHPERGPFLFCYFLGNGDGLHLAWSTEGLQMAPLNGGKNLLVARE